MRCFTSTVLLAWMLLILSEFNNGQKQLQTRSRRMRIRYVPVSSAAALRRLRFQRRLSPSKSQVIRYRTRARTSPSINVIRANSSPRVNVIRANSSPKRQSAKSTRIQNRRKVTTNNIKQTIILAKTANIMSPVGGNQNNGPSAVVSKGRQSPHRSQPPPPPPAQHPQPAAPRSDLHHHLHLNPNPNHHQNVPQHHQQQPALPVSQGHGHSAGASGQGLGSQIQGHIGSGLHLGIGGGGIETGIGAGLRGGVGGGIGGEIGGGIGGGIGRGIGGGLGSGMGAGLGELMSGLNHGIGGGGQLNAAQNAGLGGGLGENIGPLNTILGGLTGFGNSNGGLNLGTQVQGPSHGHGTNPLGALNGNGNGLHGQVGANHANSELIYQLLAGHSLNAMLEGQQTGALASLISSQNSAGKPSDILLQSLLGGNGHSINNTPNFSSLNSLLPGPRGSQSIDLSRVSSFLNGRATSLSPSFGVTQQPVIIKSNGGQLNIGLKKDPNTGKQNIVIQTAAAVMAKEMMEAEPGEAP